MGIFVIALAYFYVLAMQGDETENKDIVNQDESFMDIDSAECGLGEPAWSNRIR